MRNISVLKFILPCMILSGIVPGIVMAQEKPTLQEAPAESKAQPGEASANRKAYDALYTDILKTLPQEGKSKVDSARGRDAKAELKQPKTTLSAEEVKKDALEKRKKELDELPPEVKARVDKVLSDLDNRRKEKQTEFKELKD